MSNWARKIVPSKFFDYFFNLSNNIKLFALHFFMCCYIGLVFVNINVIICHLIFYLIFWCAHLEKFSNRNWTKRGVTGLFFWCYCFMQYELWCFLCNPSYCCCNLWLCICWKKIGKIIFYHFCWVPLLKVYYWWERSVLVYSCAWIGFELVFFCNLQRCQLTYNIFYLKICL